MLETVKFSIIFQHRLLMLKEVSIYAKVNGAKQSEI